ncbi:GNAT family N-acetyltransferase [Brachybacterium sp. EF45031]|uniref:GNAT family N-acetyltransferase n=1 Tax=Brachybacterium sillae TaxID=2810536 RepID=UPI00217E07D4|nr:GNAT family N-acetyltransferase [Brachybacterium sillae]MCS6711465.1 GNAT family N-acetyltransferase [Brachybacterium sillae]
MTVGIRDATAADIPAVLGVVEDAYRGRSGVRGWTTEEGLVREDRTSATEVRALLADPRSQLLVAVTDERVVGCCAVHPLDDEPDSPVLEFGLFAVDPVRQAGGVGGRLMDAAISWARVQGAPALRLRVLEGRPELEAWYARRGFAPTGRLVPFAGRPGTLVVAGTRMVEMERPLQDASVDSRA